MLYRVILSLGSNYNEQQNMALAVEQLKRLFLSIRFPKAITQNRWVALTALAIT